MHTNKYATIAITLCLSLMLSFHLSAMADSAWTLYRSKTLLYSVLLPNNPDEDTTEFRISAQKVLKTSETVSFEDQRPYKETIKNYIIKFDQTLGAPISVENRTQIIEREMKLFQGLYKDQFARVISRSIQNFSEQTVGELIMTYEDMNLGSQTVWLKIRMDSISKFHQIFSGPEKDYQANAIKKYMSSLNITSGITRDSGSLNNDWRRIESPFSLFAVKVPPVTPPYFLEDPVITSDKDSEKIGMTFTDPIWLQKLFYNIYGYRLDVEMSFDLAETALLEKHIKKHGRSMVGIELKKSFLGETPYIETEYTINPPKGYEYVNHVRLRAMFLGNYMMVQEVVGNKNLVDSDFTKSFFKLIEFTPKEAFQKELQRHMNFAAKPQPAIQEQPSAE